MAVVAAAMRKRYESMVPAMEQANLEPVIIEDLVKFGEDRGRTKIYVRLFAQRLGRALTDRERATVEQHLQTLGDERLNAVVLSSSPEALAAWLGDPAAH
jgi:hypothetical protein